MTTVTLDDRQLEQTRRAILEDAADDMRNAAKLLDELATVGPWPTDPTLTTESDAYNSARQVRDTLDLLDRLGWPEQDRVAGDTPSTEPNRV